MKLQAGRLALAAGVAAAVLYVLCWVIVSLLPDPTMALTEDMMHMRLDHASWHMTGRNLVVGAGGWGAFAAAFGWLLAVLYNGHGSRLRD